MLRGGGLIGRERKALLDAMLRQVGFKSWVRVRSASSIRDLT